VVFGNAILWSLAAEKQERTSTRLEIILARLCGVDTYADNAGGLDPELEEEMRELPSPRDRLFVETSGRLVKHARYFWLPLAEGRLTRQPLEACCEASQCCRSRTDSEPGDSGSSAPR